MSRIIVSGLSLLFLIINSGICLGSVHGKKISALPDSLWKKTQWISVAEAPVITGIVNDNENNRSADGSSWFIFTLDNDKEIDNVKWMTTGLGIYELYVNGNLIGEEILKPGFTHPSKTKRSFTYDVSDCINSGSGAQNIFAVQSSPGWWGDKIVTHGGSDGMKGRKTAFRGIIEVNYTDGSKNYYPTDTATWRAGITGPLVHSGIFDGICYDARKSIPVNGKGVTSVPEINNEFIGDILPSEGAEVYFRNDLALSPVESYVWEGVENVSDDCFGKVKIKKYYIPGENIKLRPGETLVIDFGQNAAAVPEFNFKAKEGTRLSCLPGELLNDGNGAKSRGMDGPEGSVHRLNLRIPDSGMRLDYIFGPSKDFVTYRPTTSFFGYRFISVSADDEVEINGIISVPVSSIADSLETGNIITGNQDVNRLISNIRWGQLSNYLSVPTDCPQRNERLGWTADTQVFAETGTFFADTRDFFHKWMRDMRDTQSVTGAFPGVAPLGQYGADPTDMNRLGWADAGIIVPWVIWKQYDDTEIIKENWESMNKFMDHLNETEYNHNRLINENGNYQWADWLSYEPLESCGGGIFDRDINGNTIVRPEAIDYWNYLSSCYWLKDALMMADMAKAIGKDPGTYLQMAEKARENILTDHLDENGDFKNEVLNTMQTPALFALHCNLMKGEAKENIKNRLRKNFEDHDYCLQTGFLGTSVLMPVLSDNGMEDIAYKLLFQRKNPSWLYSVDNGATTIWERWNSYMKDKGMGPQGMNSFNHYAYGCVGEWLWKTVAGIEADPEQPGFKKIIMKPIPDRDLGWIDASFMSPQGLVRSAWEFDGNEWIWNFSIPQGAEAEVTLPGESESKIYKAGSYKIQKKDI